MSHVLRERMLWQDVTCAVWQWHVTCDVWEDVVVTGCHVCCVRGCHTSCVTECHVNINSMYIVLYSLFPKCDKHRHVCQKQIWFFYKSIVTYLSICFYFIDCFLVVCKTGCQKLMCCWMIWVVLFVRLGLVLVPFLTVSAITSMACFLLPLLGCTSATTCVYTVHIDCHVVVSVHSCFSQ